MNGPTEKVTDPSDFTWWWNAWNKLIRCAKCRALIDASNPCFVCGSDYSNLPDLEITVQGKTLKVPQSLQGAIDWSEYVLLKLLHREWVRPMGIPDPFDGMPDPARPSQRLAIVLLFWTYFEALMQRLYESGMENLPAPIREDILKRYNFIGARMQRLHHLLFNCTFAEDLSRLGYSTVAEHLAQLQKVRNDFVHGKSSSITDDIVAQTVEFFPAFQRGWVCVFNARCTKIP
jgi:hypothetical protein